MLLRRQEKRKTLRRPTRLFAQALFGVGEQPARCVIWDMSDGGARLAIARPLTTLPPCFTLLLSKTGKLQRKCEVVWTDTHYVGVKFV
jgi:hypothetical protein